MRLLAWMTSQSSQHGILMRPFYTIIKAGLAGRPPAAAARGRQRPTLPPDRSLDVVSLLWGWSGRIRGHIPPEDHGQQQTLAVDRPRSSACPFGQNRRSSNHPGSLSHGGSQQSSALTRENAGDRLGLDGASAWRHLQASPGADGIGLPRSRVGRARTEPTEGRRGMILSVLVTLAFVMTLLWMLVRAFTGPIRHRHRRPVH
jgi:hypothetical protein